MSTKTTGRNGGNRATQKEKTSSQDITTPGPVVPTIAQIDARFAKATARIKVLHARCVRSLANIKKMDARGGRS